MLNSPGYFCWSKYRHVLPNYTAAKVSRRGVQNVKICRCGTQPGYGASTCQGPCCARGKVRRYYLNLPSSQSCQKTYIWSFLSGTSLSHSKALPQWEPPTSPAFAATGAVAWIFVGCNRLWEDNTEASKMCTIAIATALANDGLRVRAVPILATMDRARAWGVETRGWNN